jgi:hypothetical protein
MKISRFFLFFLVCLMFVGIVCAEEPAVPEGSHVNGGVIQNISLEHGDINVGGNFAGGSSALFDANGCKPNGLADVFGKGSGESIISTDLKLAQSFSKAFVSSNVQTEGDTLKIDLSGFISQINNAQLGDNQNGASGGNSTYGDYEGSKIEDPNVTGPQTAEGLGKAGAAGKTTVAVSEVPDTSKHAEVKTLGMSFGNVDVGNNGTVGTSALGLGSINAISQIGGDTGQNFYAGASSVGSASFKGIGEKYSGGSLGLNGTTDVTRSTDSNSVTAGAHVGSGASLFGGICPGASCGN